MRPVAAAAQLLPPPQTMPHVSRALRHAKVFVVMVTGDDLRAVQRGSRNGSRNGCYAAVPERAWAVSDVVPH
jgi:hypothetical protein